MPYLNGVPESFPSDVFVMGEQSLPQPKKWARLLMKTLLVPVVGRSGMVQRQLARALDVPETTHFAAGFTSRGGRLHCGRCVSLSDTVFFDYAPVFLEDYVGFSFRNVLITSTHDTRDFRRVIARSIILERNVWVTTNVVILGGVRIGQNSIIAAGSVVTHDIPANVLAGGNPCHVLRHIERGVDRPGCTRATGEVSLA